MSSEKAYLLPRKSNDSYPSSFQSSSAGESSSRDRSVGRWTVLACVGILVGVFAISNHFAVPLSKSQEYRAGALDGGLDMGVADGNNVEQNQKKKIIRVAHLGNSIQYYNDCPRLLQHMLEVTYDVVIQDSCLHGGASLVTLLVEGNGMQETFSTPNALLDDGTYDIGSPTVSILLAPERQWDYVIMNDQTQSPARDVTRSATLQHLREVYIPLLSNKTAIFLMTAAYRRNAKGSEEFGTFDEFTALLESGYEEYADAVPNSKVAPVGLAFQIVRNRFPTSETGEFNWEMMYQIDDFHPSPHGTLLEAYVLYCTMLQEAPPKYDPTWWRTARVMQPPDEAPLPLPTPKEAEELRRIACEICNLPF